MGLPTVVAVSLGLAAFLTAYHITSTMTRVLSVPQKDLLLPRQASKGGGFDQAEFRKRPARLRGGAPLDDQRGLPSADRGECRLPL